MQIYSEFFLLNIRPGIIKKYIRLLIYPYENMSAQEILLFNDRNEWRTWLEKNHRTLLEVWLLHYKKQLRKKSLNHIDAVEEALCIHQENQKVSGRK